MPSMIGASTPNFLARLNAALHNRQGLCTRSVQHWAASVQTQAQKQGQVHAQQAGVCQQPFKLE